ncbi:MAG: 23S rRNA (uracil(1939)-C(5))-methyltransferase RlmD [Lachnospiraceae bacterium]
MKKGQVLEGIITKVEFPNKGIVQLEDGKSVVVKNGIEGQKVLFSVNRVRKGKGEGRLLQVLEKSPLELSTPNCIHFGECGGCTYQNLSYEMQLSLKERQVKDLLAQVLTPESKAIDEIWEGIKSSPQQFGYRNKMEFSFGDLCKDGPLALGMHKRGSFYDIVPVEECRTVDEDFRKILTTTLDFFRKNQIPFYHKVRHEGYLRHLLVRKGFHTGEVLIDLVTTTQIAEDGYLLDGFTKAIEGLELSGKLMGVLHTQNDCVGDTVTDEGTEVLFGRDFFFEKLLGLQFKITPFSFFQTNSAGAEVLYETVRDFVGDLSMSQEPNQIIFDLYSGTGTIAQILSPIAKKVIGVELVEAAVEAANENAQRNGLSNCEFIAGDVLKVLDTIPEKPDFIILDPPRDGIHPKALERIIQYDVERMVYISCKPTSLARDLVVLQARGYCLERVACVDMFPGAVHVETIVALHRKDT